MPITINPLTTAGFPELDQLFSTDKSAAKCWCMWFITSVNDFHSGGPKENKAKFMALESSSTVPMGLLAYEGNDLVGWCAVGPRSRYVRAIKTPTFRHRDPAEDHEAWFVPCFFIRPDKRNQGISRELLKAAVQLARDHGAVAIEGFPYTSGGRRSVDTQVGFAPAFTALGFTTTRHPSTNRVVMRLDL